MKRDFWHEGQSWDAFVTKVKGLVGDNVSVSPMEGRMKELVGQVIETLEENAKSLAKQTEAVLLLEKEVKDLRPVREQARELQKKVDDLESKAKSMKTEMNGLNRKLSEFEGKVAIDHEDLMQNIKDAIKAWPERSFHRPRCCQHHRSCFRLLSGRCCRKRS